MRSILLSMAVVLATANFSAAQSCEKPVNAAVHIPVTFMAMVDATDPATIEASVAYNHSSLNLQWNFVPITTGQMTQTAVTPTESDGDYDWRVVGNGYYEIEMPASGGASVNNDTEGFGWFSGGGGASGLLPFSGPVVRFSNNPRRNSVSPIQ